MINVNEQPMTPVQVLEQRIKTINQMLNEHVQLTKDIKELAVEIRRLVTTERHASN